MEGGKKQTHINTILLHNPQRMTRTQWGSVHPLVCYVYRVHISVGTGPRELWSRSGRRRRRGRRRQGGLGEGGGGGLADPV